MIGLVAILEIAVNERARVGALGDQRGITTENLGDHGLNPGEKLSKRGTCWHVRSTGGTRGRSDSSWGWVSCWVRVSGSRCHGNAGRGEG